MLKQKLSTLLVFSMAFMLLTACSPKEESGNQAANEPIGEQAVVEQSDDQAVVEDDPQAVLERAIDALPANREVTWDDCEQGFPGKDYSLHLSVDALTGRWPGDGSTVKVPGEVRLTSFSLEAPDADVESEEFRQWAWDVLRSKGLDDKYTPDDIAATFGSASVRIAPQDSPSEEQGFRFNLYRLDGIWYFIMDS